MVSVQRVQRRNMDHWILVSIHLRNSSQSIPPRYKALRLAAVRKAELVARWAPHAAYVTTYE